MSSKNKVKIFLIAIAALFGALFVEAAYPQSTPQPPADVPISHVLITGQATGFNGPKGAQAATLEAFGLQVTEYVSVAYEHVQVPAANVRYEFGLVNFSKTLPKFKSFVFDTSNIVYTFSAGAGKYFAPNGTNHVAETAAASITYPLAKHMGWQILSYQYIHSPASGLINKSYQDASTGPVFYF